MHTSYNRLIKEKSPYLLQHAHNPVHWFSWGDEPLEIAKKENKLILVSIGYAACHWCHVMESESFENQEIAEILNENFISIKVDREERPDIDQVYMSAVQLMAGTGGWPLNCFLTPEGLPFYGGTYFPQQQFKDILIQLHSLWQESEGTIKEHATALCEGIMNSELIKEKTTYSGSISSDNIYRLIRKDFDCIDGGLNRVPKFPMPTLYRYLCDYYYIFSDPGALQQAELSCDKILAGGIYDQLGGGISRYSTDRYWFVPHFEKMLYDNAQFVSFLSDLYSLTGKESYARAIDESINFLNKNMMNDQHAYYSSLDADSEGEEGKYYVWNYEEIDKVSGKDFPIIKDHFGIEQTGNWENGKNLLKINMNYKELAEKYLIAEPEIRDIIEVNKQKLLDLREKRVHPEMDTKVLTSWNALMIMALTDAWQATGKDEFLVQAGRTAQFILENVKNDNLKRSYESNIPGFLDDYAFTAEAFIALYQTEFDEKWLLQAKKFTDYCLEHFFDDKTGMFFYNSDSELNPVGRQSEIVDSVIPSSNSSMSVVLYYLSVYFDNPSYLELSQQMLINIIPHMTKNASFFSNWARRLLLDEMGSREVIISGGDVKKQRRKFCGIFLPMVLFAGSDDQSEISLLKSRNQFSYTQIYVCKEKVCRQPVNSVEEALKELL